ncbi:hypothetical protein [Streptomyces avicenniae]|uniref:COG4315 family predicted lipoprotein n=1 Tax=Streptomyces avicenniae TaxID=500153 RepID=UPI00069ADABE|nr:hypothetical protein [Streptomyces avicenniae]
MRTKLTLGLATAAITLLGLTACSSDDDGGDASASDDSSASQESTYTDPTPAEDEAPPAEETAAGTALATADTALGTIVVDGEGRTLYQFDTDTQGGDASTCEGQCADNWPAVPAEGTPELDGVTGEVGTITGIDGEPQLTLDGWPLYYFAGDEAAGDTNGQAVGGVWWVLTPAGEPIRD